MYKLWDNRERKLDDLVSHHDKFDRNKERIAVRFCEQLVDRFEKLLNVKLDMDELWRLVCILKINSLTVCDRNYHDRYLYKEIIN